MKIDFDHFRGAEIATGNMTQAKREAAALSTLIKHVEDTERMLEAATEIAITVNEKMDKLYKLGGKWHANSSLIEDWHPSPFSAFLALEEKK
jgi:hypothetical protein